MKKVLCVCAQLPVLPIPDWDGAGALRLFQLQTPFHPDSISPAGLLICGLHQNTVHIALPFPASSLAHPQRWAGWDGEYFKPQALFWRCNYGLLRPILLSGDAESSLLFEFPAVWTDSCGILRVLDCTSLVGPRSARAAWRVCACTRECRHMSL